MRYILYLHRLSPYLFCSFLINCKSEISFKEGELFSNEVADFNFELSPDQIFSGISDLDFAYTQVFNKEQEHRFQISNHQSIFQKLNLNSNDPYSLECSLGDLSQYDNTNEVENAVNIEKSEKLNAFNDQLNSIFKASKDKNKELANRKDVINKAILRGFKKFFVNLLTQSKTSLPEISNQNFIEQISKLGLLDLKPNESSQEEFSEFICWMGYPKITKKVRSLFSLNNPAIILMEDVLSSYSHHKLNQFMNNKSIKVLLSYFILHGKEQFMDNIGLSIENHDSLNQNSFSHMKKDAECYEEALQSIYNQISSS